MLDRHEEALQCLDKVLELDPRYAKAWNDKGAALVKVDRHEEALQCFDRALAIDPKNTTAQQGKPVAVENIRKTGPKQ
jgi:tetratricopeptide (TPR) repeat protein